MWRMYVPKYLPTTCALGVVFVQSYVRPKPSRCNLTVLANIMGIPPLFWLKHFRKAVRNLELSGQTWQYVREEALRRSRAQLCRAIGKSQFSDVGSVREKCTMSFLIHKYKAFKDIHPDSRKIFVIGCGRSGTHWVGNILSDHPDIRVTVEKKPIFDKVTAIAVNPSKMKRLLKPLIRWYRFEHALAAPRHYADKSHPNIWLVEELASVFPRSLFVGIQRDPYGTVSSMLKNKGVRMWCERWEDYPVPNRFLGITTANVETYRNLSLAGKCALRWLCHAERMKEVKKKVPERVHIIQYENLILNVQQELIRLQEFLGLSAPIPVPEVKRGSLDKWLSNLTEENCIDIERVTGYPRLPEDSMMPV